MHESGVRGRLGADDAMAVTARLGVEAAAAADDLLLGSLHVQRKK